MPWIKRLCLCGGAPNGAAPVPQGAVTFADIAAASVTVNWQAATDADSLQSNLQYKLVRAIDNADIDTIAEADAISGSDLVMDWTVNTLTFDVTGLSGHWFGYYAVVVKDGTGNKALYAAQIVYSPPITTNCISLGGLWRPDGLGGYGCWFLGAQAQSCDDACAALGHTCVNADWEDFDGCKVCMELAGGSVCSPNNPGGAAPKINGAWCYTRQNTSDPQICSAVPAEPTARRLCVCWQ